MQMLTSPETAGARPFDPDGPPASTPLIQFDGASLRYGRGENAVQALAETDLKVFAVRE